MDKSNTVAPVRIRDLVLYYLRLGTLGFGGPVALCGQMEKELVQERSWLSKEEMRDGIAVCQSLPGPLAIQVGIFISYLRGGFWGAWAGGWAFILPNFIIVSALGALYVHFSGLPILTSIFYGVSPAVIALILHSCYRLAKLGMEDWLQWAIAVACFFITIALRAEVAALFIAAGLVGVIYYGSFFRRRAALPSGTAVLGAGIGLGKIGGFPILGKLLFFFLKAGSLTFGSGLVIVPFLEKGLVQNTGWLDERQFLVAVCDRDDQSWSGGNNGDICWLPGRRMLGCNPIHYWHFSAVVPLRPGCRAHSRASPGSTRRTRIRQGRLCGRNRDDPRGLGAA